jgi:hypothetical protein
VIFLVLKLSILFYFADIFFSVKDIAFSIVTKRRRLPEKSKVFWRSMVIFVLWFSIIWVEDYFRCPNSTGRSTTLSAETLLFYNGLQLKLGAIFLIFGGGMLTFYFKAGKTEWHKQS